MYNPYPAINQNNARNLNEVKKGTLLIGRDNGLWYEVLSVYRNGRLKVKCLKPLPIRVDVNGKTLYAPAEFSNVSRYSFRVARYDNRTYNRKVMDAKRAEKELKEAA